MHTVLFACVHNAGRSQMAAAYFNQFANTARRLHLRRAELDTPVISAAQAAPGASARDVHCPSESRRGWLSTVPSQRQSFALNATCTQHIRISYNRLQSTFIPLLIFDRMDA